MPKDDRPIDNISWAATNLVKPDLLKTAREAAMVPAASKSSPKAASFPPTPPPESEKALARGNTVATRANSVRRPPDLRERRRDNDIHPDDHRDHRDDDYSPNNPARRPSVRDQPPRRAASNASRRAPSRSGTVSSRRRVQEQFSDHDEQYEDELYDLYNEPPRRSNTTNRRPLVRRNTTRRYDDDEYASDGYEGSSFDDEEFEMLETRNTHTRSASRRAPEIKKVSLVGCLASSSGL